MVSQLRICQREDRGRKKHSLVIGMRNEQTDPLVSQLGESGPRHVDSVHPRCDHYNRQREDCEPLHGCGALILNSGEKVEESPVG